MCSSNRFTCGYAVNVSTRTYQFYMLSYRSFVASHKLRIHAIEVHDNLQFLAIIISQYASKMQTFFKKFTVSMFLWCTCKSSALKWWGELGRLGVLCADAKRSSKARRTAEPTDWLSQREFNWFKNFEIRQRHWGTRAGERLSADVCVPDSQIAACLVKQCLFMTTILSVESTLSPKSQ